MQAVKFVGTFSALCLCVAASAEPAGVDISGLTLTPTLSIQYFHDDNLTRSDTTVIESNGYKLRPKLALAGEFGSNALLLTYQGEKGQYNDSKQDDYTDHLLNADLYYEFGSKHRLNVLANYADTHDARGTAYSLGAGNTLLSPDRFTETMVAASYTFGAKTAEARIQIKANQLQTDYDINTDLYRLRDRTSNRLNGLFFYRVAANTDLLIDAGINDIAYDFALSSDTQLDSTEASLLVGAQWQLSGSTQGFAKIGYQQKSFDVEQRDRFTGLTWQAGFDWTPTRYSSISISSQLGVNETNGQSDFIRSQDVDLAWQHSWLERFNSVVELRYGKDRYAGADSEREDHVGAATLRFQYQLQRWLRLDLDLQHETRSSNSERIDYDQNRYGITAHVSL